MPTSDTIRVGMIGCGGNARGHMGRLKAIDGVQIVALVDTSEASLKATVEAHPDLAKLPRFDDHKDMFAQVEMDAVEISTPHVFHYEQIIDSLDAGLHVLCEKPMVCTTEHALAVVEKVRQTGLVMGISYQRHFMGPYRYCREKILGGEAGKVNFVSASQSQNWYRGQVPRGTWRSKMALSCGGQLNDSGSHLLDIVLWMTGLEPKRVFSIENNLDAEVDILSALSVEFDGGALCNLSVVGHAVNFFEHITIFCEKATYFIPGIGGGEIYEWVGGEQRTAVAGEELPAFGHPDANFIAAIRGEEEIQAPPECGVQVIRLTEAAWESARTGLAVDVPALP